MLVTVSTFVKDCLTTKDGESYDVARFGMFLGTLVICGIAIYGLFHTTVVLSELGSMLQNLGISLATLIGGASAGIGMKAKSEPDA